MSTHIRSRHFRFVLILCFAVVASGIVTTIPQEAAAGEGVASSITSTPATHKQKQTIKVAKSSEGQKLEDFCIDREGRILVLLGPIGPDDDEQAESEGDNSILDFANRLLGSNKKKLPKFESAIHVYDRDGTATEQWTVGFSGQAINTAPDGSIVVGGDGRLARFDATGIKLLEAESPQMTYINDNPAEMRERAQEQLESDRKMYADYVEQFKDQLKQLQDAKKEGKKPAKPAEDSEAEDDNQSPFGGMNEQNLKAMVDAYQQMANRFEKKTVEEALAEVTARARRIHAITASNDEIFVTCPAMAGYGYGVWRTDTKFEQAKEIVKSLSGCCGQMDVQCHNGELYVCENSRHRVIRLDRDGKQLAQFGKRDREGAGENFGGCCNPMNLCFNKNGDLYVSESNGVVKHFTPDGSYVGIVGVAEVQPGCKNSCVGVTANDDRLFYIDVLKSQIIILARNENVAP